MTMQNTTQSPLCNAAIAYVTRGFAIFPCQPRGKVPATPHGCRDATKDLTRISAWWRENPSYNVAVATGPGSGVFVLDVDGLDAEANLRNLEDQYGALPETVESITPRGRHIFFRCKNAPVKNSASAIAPGLDIRADGGYVVLPPSMHPTGRPYIWSVDSADHFAEAPAWLSNLLSGTSNGKCTHKTKAPEHWHSALINTIRNGARNNTLTSICGKLLHAGLTELAFLYDVMCCINIARCEQPLPEIEVHTIVASVARIHLKRLRGDA
jgi:Bifunctional DNA primase/polymerase, N-terminal/Primase C terminal 1 (PriCT-1)